MENVLAPDELASLLAAVDRFATRAVAPLVARHEITLAPHQLEQLAREAEAAGLLNLGTRAGLGLFENLSEPAGVQLTVAALARLAEENAGVAWHCAQLAFGRWLALRLGFTAAVEQGPVVATLQGHYGLGRTALPRYLAGVELAEDEQALLADTFAPQDPQARQVLHALDGWRWLLAPCFEAGQIQWRLVPREAPACEPSPHSHGLDEIPAWRWTLPGERAAGVATTRLAAGDARELYAQALQLDALALLAIALGAVRHAYRIARDYAAIRRQGGTTIDRLPAVQQLLARVHSAITLSAAQLNQLALAPPARERTGEILAARSRLQPLLSRAASDALQALGGIGYMRDTGVEKTLRDANQLRLVSGTPGELELFVAEWERLPRERLHGDRTR
jgi:alkylation response protein AidB-like acyl-CoA dehydrogenase